MRTIEIFKLFGSIMVDSSKAEDSISKTDTKAKGFFNSLGGGMKTVAKFGTAVAGATAIGAAALYGLATKAAQATDHIDKMSQKIGLSRQAYQEFDYICSQSGTSVDSLKNGMKRLTNSMDDAANGSAAASKKFERLNLSVKDSNGAMKSQEQMLFETLEALQKVENETERAALANDLLGNSAQELMPLLNSGAGSIEEMKKQAHELGLVIEDDAIDAGVKLTDTIDKVKRTISSITTKIGVSVMPLIQKFFDFILKKMPIIQAVLSTVFKGIEFFVDGVCTVIANVFGDLTDETEGFFENIKSIWEDYGKPIFEALMQTIEVIWNNSQPIFEGLKKLFGVLMDYIKESWESVGKPVFDFFMGCVTKILEVFNRIFPVAANIFGGLCSTLANLWEEVLKPIFQAIGDFIEEVLLPVFEIVFDKILSKVETVFNFIADLWNNSLKPILDGIIEFVGGVFSGNWEKAWNGIVGVFEGIWNGLARIVKGIVNSTLIKGMNLVISGINLLSFEVPDWIPGVGGEKFGFDISPVPEWYAEGAVLTKPTAFGFNPYSGKTMVGGEAGPEAIAPVSVLLDYIRQAVQESVQQIDYIKMMEAFINAIKATGMNQMNIFMSAEKVGKALSSVNDEIGGYNIALEGRRNGL